MKTISPSELKNRLQSQPDLALIDVRSPAEYGQVHVAQARNLPLDSLAPQTLYSQGTLPRDTPVYILCQSGKRATAAAEKFASEGFDHSIVVEGGTQAWTDAGFPVERGSGKMISLQRQVFITAGALVVTGVVFSFAVHPYFIGLSAFVGAGLVFAGITDWCGLGLLLAKAPWNRSSGH